MKCVTADCSKKAKKMVLLRVPERVEPMCGPCLADALRAKNVAQVLGKA